MSAKHNRLSNLNPEQFSNVLKMIRTIHQIFLGAHHEVNPMQEDNGNCSLTLYSCFAEAGCLSLLSASVIGASVIGVF